MGLILHSHSNGSVTDPVVDVREVPLVLLLDEKPLVLDAVQEPETPLMLDIEAPSVHETKAPLILDIKEVPPAYEGKKSLLLDVDGTLPVQEPEERDPHVVPTFTTESVAYPTSTVLFLPPLLSSLPKDVSMPPIATDRPTMVTETRLPDIDPVSLSLHKALHYFRPVSQDYAALAYALAFNWSELDLPEDEEREWYAVAFRSRRKKGSDSGPLYEADRKAHEEAVCNGGLIMYWYGVPDPDTGMNLATCIWQSRKHAIAANSRPYHIRAMRLAAESYEIYALERYRLTKMNGEKGILVEDFSGEDCGW